MDIEQADTDRRERAEEVRRWSTDEFYGLLVKAGIQRAYLVYENGEFTASHDSPLLAAVRAFFELSHDFSAHEAVFVGRDDGTKTPFFAFVHDTRRGLSQGGLRIEQYGNMAELLTDGLRLSKGMTQKNALAGLNWGGGKGIIAMPTGFGKEPEDFRDGAQYSEVRKSLFTEYGRFVASLHGLYYTAEDMATNTRDMDVLLAANRFTTCISRELGGSGNPSAFTAQGVYDAMRAAWKVLPKSRRQPDATKTEDLGGVRVTVQGVGNVGRPLVELLYKAGAHVVISDEIPAALNATETLLGVSAVPCTTAEAVYADPSVRFWILDDPLAIFNVRTDIFSPCGRGSQLDSETISQLDLSMVSLICGAANNQLKNPKDDGEQLLSSEIIYVPDYLCNRMGIVNCADEWLGYLEEDVILAGKRVYPDTLRVLRHAKELGITTQDAAGSLADVAASELHPVLGHRGRRIIDFIQRSSWLTTKFPRNDSVSKQEDEVFRPAFDEPRLQHEAEQCGPAGTGPSILATPIPATAHPHLGLFLSPLLMDIEVRRRSGQARGVSGVDHGGQALQSAIERSLPYPRAETSRSAFRRACRDRFNSNDVVIRRQLSELGIAIDADRWLDSTSPLGEAVVREAYRSLCDSNRISHSKTTAGDNSSLQHHADFSHEARELQRLIESGEVVFNDEQWRSVALSQLKKLSSWYISENSWWGNEVPDGGGNMFSQWFSLGASALQAAGWPGTVDPEPIDVVYTDPERLMCWILPSQCLALAIYGRPVFREIRIHGTVHVIERMDDDKRRVVDVADNAHDEQRFLYRTEPRPMQTELGNVVEPETLVARFGADALRLWYVLSLRGGATDIVTLAEKDARAARGAVKQINRSLSHMLGNRADAVDDGLVADIAGVVDKAEHAWSTNNLGAVGEAFLEAAEVIGRHEQTTAATASAVVERLHSTFHPICPFLLTKFREVARPAPRSDT